MWRGGEHDAFCLHENNFRPAEEKTGTKHRGEALRPYQLGFRGDSVLYSGGREGEHDAFCLLENNFPPPGEKAGIQH